MAEEKQIVITAVSQTGRAFQRVSDMDVVLAAVAQNGWCLQYSKGYANEKKDICLVAVSQTLNALPLVSKELQKDRDILLAAVKQQYSTVNKSYFAPFCDDKEFMLAAGEYNGFTLTHAAPELKADKEVVLTAVAQYGMILKEAAEELKNDPEVAVAAVAQNRRALQFVSAELREGALKAHVAQLRRAHRGMVCFMAAAAPKPAAATSEAKGKAAPAPAGHPLKKLHGHGVHFSTKFQRTIAHFAGAPLGPDWVATVAVESCV